MPLLIKHGYRRKYVVGGRGLFDTVANLAGRIFTSSAAKTLGSKAMSAATNAALKGVEKGASKAVDYMIDKATSKPRNLVKPSNPTMTPHQQARLNNLISGNNSTMTPHQQARLNDLISGSGIATIHDFVRRYK